MREGSILSSFSSDLRIKFPNLACGGLKLDEPMAKHDANNNNIYRIYYSISLTSIGSACCSIIEATQYANTSPLQSGVSQTQAIAEALYSALLTFCEAKGAKIAIFHGLQSDFKLLCAPEFSSRVTKEMLERYYSILSDNYVGHHKISCKTKHKVYQTCAGEAHCPALAENHCPGISVPVDYNCIKAELLQHLVAETNRIWQNDADNLTAKIFIEEIDFKRSGSLTSLPQADLKALTEIVSGH